MSFRNVRDEDLAMGGGRFESWALDREVSAELKPGEIQASKSCTALKHMTQSSNRDVPRSVV